jgi:hypothetical protein
MSQKLTPSYADARGVIATGFGGIGFGLICEGSGAPTNGVAGYQTGALWHRRDGGAATALYLNVGNETSSSWVIVGGTGVDLSGLVATAAEINRNNAVSTRLVASGASLTVTQALHDGKTIVLAAAAAITLPAMSGSGSRFRFVLPQDATAVTITATAAHLFGALNQNNDTAQGTGFQLPAINASGSTIITLDGTTKGGRKGDWIELEDVASGVGILHGQLNASGTEASPFS